MEALFIAYPAEEIRYEGPNASPQFFRLSSSTA